MTEVPEKTPALPGEAGQDADLMIAQQIERGVGRLLGALGIASVSELPLANGRRADVAGLTRDGKVWIVEIKSSLADLRSDRKWPEYRDYCDQLFFAVMADFPREHLPPDTGLMLADRFGGEIVREAPSHPLSAARRKAMTLAFARCAAVRLRSFIDPKLDPLNFRGEV